MELVTFKDEFVDFTEEECILDLSQKKPYKEVKQEYIQNLLFLDAETRHEVKTMTRNPGIFVEEHELPRFKNDGVCEFKLREIHDSNIKTDENPKSNCELDENGNRLRQSSVLNQCKKIISRNYYFQDSDNKRSFTDQIELFQCQEKPPEIQVHRGNKWKMGLNKSAGLIRYQKSAIGEMLSVSHKGGMDFSGTSSLALYQTIQNEGIHFEVNECGKDFLPNCSVAIYQRIHNAEKHHECNNCGKAFTWKSSLARHQKVCTEQKCHKCDVCEKVFKWNHNLATHQRIHTRKKHECNHCGKAFTKNCQLARHQKVHTGEKPYQCNQCRKVFRQKNHLARHQKIHTGEKTFRCNQCGNAFKYSTHLAKHKSRHQRETLWK